MATPDPPTTTIAGNPHDTGASAASRFLIELAAWVAGPWATYDRTDSTVLAILALIVLVALPAVFNVPGDKKVTGKAVSGETRMAIEMVLLAVAVVAASVIWPTWVAIAVGVLGAVMIATGLKRYVWLASQ